MGLLTERPVFLGILRSSSCLGNFKCSTEGANCFSSYLINASSDSNSWIFNHSINSPKSGIVQGVPVRIAIGHKDMKNKTFEVARRDTGAKSFVSWDDTLTHVTELLGQIQASFRLYNLQVLADLD